MRLLSTKITALCLLFFALSYGDIELQTTDSDITLSISGKGWVESGQLVDYFNNGQEIEHTWLSRTFLDLLFNATYKERLHISLGTEGRMWFNIPKVTGTGQATYVHRQNGSLIVSDANASYSFGNVVAPFLSATMGLFPYKYNQQVRNLGEYLFRSGTYPAYLINIFDLPFARLTGLKLSGDLFGCWHQDLIYSFETTIPPFFDGTVSYLTSYHFRNIIDIGAGVSFANLVSVDENVTTPKTGVNATRNKYVTASGDTGFYTFSGTKLMGRFCFDPKGIFPLDIFGKEDLKLYAEAAVLGLESYPRNDSITAFNSGRSSKTNIYGYDVLKKKIPVMLGFNVPTFKILDVLSLEAEWYKCPYPNSYLNRLGPGKDLSYPVPDPVKRTNVDYRTDTWKWSVYIKKTFLDEHLGFVLQFARDHVRNETLIDESFDYEEALSLNKQWWWMMKLVAQF
jgi:hypothetical protein